MPIAPDVCCGKYVIVHHPELVNLYGCRIGDETRIGAFVEIQKNATIGARCKISTHTFVCEGVTIEDDVFVGHGVVFINDPFPRATTDNRPQTEADWTVVPTLVKRGASIGSGAVILGGVTIGEHALVGAGAVVTHDVPDHAIVVGVPARVVGDVREREGRRVVVPLNVPGRLAAFGVLTNVPNYAEERVNSR
jgi:UDP-2-acetamido-3-amino-2,3-dideoxy-glucuronate N-acetyltransferase